MAFYKKTKMKVNGKWYPKAVLVSSPATTPVSLNISINGSALVLQRNKGVSSAVSYSLVLTFFISLV